MAPTIDMTGLQFGRLTAKHAVKRAGIVSRDTFWLCVCECGRETVVSGAYLRNGTTKSCGCLRHDLLVARLRTHGQSGCPEYATWNGMKARCYNPKSNVYRHYGGRGISVCERWRDSFENFFSDMGPMPRAGGTRNAYSLDRIDNDGPYAPENCRWATQSQQVQNSRHARLITHNGATRSLREWSAQIGLSERALSERIAMWGVARALTTPPLVRRGPDRRKRAPYRSRMA